MKKLLLIAAIMVATATGAFAGNQCIQVAKLANDIFDLRAANLPIEDTITMMAGDSQSIRNMVAEAYKIKMMWIINTGGGSAHRGIFVKRWTDACLAGN